MADNLEQKDIPQTEQEFKPEHDFWLKSHYGAIIAELMNGLKTPEQAQQQLIDERKALEQQIYTDKLTGINNRRGIDKDLVTEFEKINRAGKGELTAAFLDVDKFKLINDTFSHKIGDEVLIIYAKVIADSVRPGDIVGRYGGDEFVAIFPGANIDIVEQRVEEMRKQIIIQVQQKFDELGLQLNWQQTVSAGIEKMLPNDKPEDLLNRADIALNWAKKVGGRNKVAVYQKSMQAEIVEFDEKQLATSTNNVPS